MTDYERDTRAGYRSAERAARYRAYHTKKWSWGRVATWAEQRAIRRMLRRQIRPGRDLVLDIPCGTGILGASLDQCDVRVVASDIAVEMIALAVPEYDGRRCAGFVQADITGTPFSDGRFDGVLTLGFMHRVPEDVRRRALSEISRVTARFAIISFSLDSPLQRLKHGLLNAMTRRPISAPCAAPLEEVEREIRDAGFRIERRVSVLPFLSAETLFVLERSDAA